MAAAAKKPSPAHRRLDRAALRNFYGPVLTDAERKQIDEAMGVEGLEHEIAVLRVKLKTALSERPEDLELLKEGVAILVRAVATQYRLSPKARKDLAESFAATLNGLADQLLPTGS